MSPEPKFPVIEYHQLQIGVFLPLSTLGSFAVNAATYPLTVMRTRLQLQEGRSMYRGLADCLRRVTAEEGLRGLYAGFWVKSVQSASSLLYVLTYESVRAHAGGLSPSARSFVGGGCASLVAQTVLVPIDIVAQHLMLLSPAASGSATCSRRRLTPLSLPPRCQRTAAARTAGVVAALYRQQGLRSFYQGYLVSLLHFVPNSALWWGFYNTYCDQVSRLLSSLAGGRSRAGDADAAWRPPRLLVQAASAPLAGMSAGLIMNPVDVVRVRVQVEGLGLAATLRRLVAAEGLRFGWKGLSARLLQSAFFSFFIVLSYEPVKRYSLKEEYKASISW